MKQSKIDIRNNKNDCTHTHVRALNVAENHEIGLMLLYCLDCPFTRFTSRRIEQLEDKRKGYKLKKSYGFNG